MQFPDYKSIDLTKTNLKWGYYVPGLIEQYRPDIELIGIYLDLSDYCDHNGHLIKHHDEADYSWLPQKIDQALKANKKIGLVVEDEHTTFFQNKQLIDIVNQYQNQPVYWLTQHFPKNIKKHYQDGYGLQCKMLEFPWVILNECLMYDKVKPTVVSRTNMIPNGQNNFFALAGRYEPWRKRFLEKLIEHDLHNHGKITVLNTPDRANYNLEFNVVLDSSIPYSNQPNKLHAKMAAQFLKKNTWISCNTANFLHLEQNYRNYPLTIIPETHFADYFSTEKSVWPILLGKLFLIFGSDGCMKYIQRFYDIDMSEFLNLEFDDMKNIELKMESMIKSNKDFILNSHRVYAKYYQQIQHAKHTIGPNLYQFLLHQIDQIQ